MNTRIIRAGAVMTVNNKYFHKYELVQAERPKLLSAASAACNIYSSVTWSLSCWPPMTAKEGGIASFC